MKILISFLLLMMYGSNSFSQENTVARRHEFIFFNDSKDSILLQPVCGGEGFVRRNSKVADSVQVDGRGAKELVIYRTCSSIISKHGGTFDIDESTSISKYEIWDCENKKMLFDATVEYHSQFNRFNALKMMGHVQGRIKYSSQFQIAKDGSILIRDAKIEDDVYRVEWKQVTKDGKEETIVEKKKQPSGKYFGNGNGNYKFINGRYQKVN